LEDRTHFYKILYFGDKEDDSENIKPYLKGLSVWLRNLMSFGYVDFDHKAVRKSFLNIKQHEKTLIFLTPKSREVVGEGLFNVHEFNDGELSPKNFPKMEDFIIQILFAE
jgi:hypothetical protein